MRNMRRLHIDTTVAMKIVGRKTDAIFRRYNIVDNADLEEAARKLDEKAVGIVNGIAERKKVRAMAQAV